MTQEEFQKLLNKRIWEAEQFPNVFIDTFLYTFNPKQEPYHLPFRLFDFQKDLVTDLQDHIERGEDIFIEKCREMGATYTVLAVLLWFWCYIPGSNFLLGSRKEQYVDSTGSKGEVSNKEESLFGKLDYMLRRVEVPEILPKGFNQKKHMRYMSLLNPVNGNVISGESSNENFSRGGRFKAILLDEFAFWENDSAAYGSTADTTRCRIILTTPGIKPSKAKRLRQGRDGEKIRIVTLPYSLDPRKTPEWLEYERSRRSAEDFAREIMINWESSIQGIVYPEIKQAEIGNYPYIEHESLYTTWDFGLDGVAIQWWQRNPDNNRMRLLESYFNENKPISYYFLFFGKKELELDTGEKVLLENLYQYSKDDFELRDIVSKWKKPIHFGDPDVSKRSLLTGTSTRQALGKAGIFVYTRPEDNDFISRREKTKVMLQHGIEVDDTPRNRFYIECIEQARYPHREETSQATSAISKPIHDWTSHHRTATEYLAVNYNRNFEYKEPEPEPEPNTFNSIFERIKRDKYIRREYVGYD